MACNLHTVLHYVSKAELDKLKAEILEGRDAYRHMEH